MVVAPRSETEHGVTALWAEVVGAWPRSIDDEFVAMGTGPGQAEELLARVYERWRVTITLDEFLAASSIARLSAMIERKVAEARTHANDLLSGALTELDSWHDLP
jgi:hypothetical protein